MKTILTVFGTRPEGIKMCPLVKELQNHPETNCVVCVTGQHKEMLEQVLDTFDVVPDYDLSIMKQRQSLYDITTNVLMQMEGVLNSAKPDVVLVHGDTTTSFAAALASYYQQIPVGHVEAGLRTRNLYSPYPEEFNRQAVDSLAAYHFAPTRTAAQNLIDERKPADGIIVTGNTVIDALKTTVREGYEHPALAWASDSRLLLITAHRRENLGQPMRNMFRAIRRVIESFPDVKAIYPIHLNPVVREIANQELGDCSRLKLIEPVDVLDFHNLMAHSYLVLTDSGGIQEEAPALGKPVLVMRDTTERPEGVAAGTLKLTGTSEARIFEECSRLLEDKAEYERMAQTSNPYGDGFASARITRFLAGEPFEEFSVSI